MALHGRGNPHWMWHAVFSFWSWHSSHWSCLHCQIGKDGGGYNPNLLIFFSAMLQLMLKISARKSPRFFRRGTPRGSLEGSCGLRALVPSASTRHGQTAAEVTNGMDDVVRSHQYQRCQRGWWFPRNGGFTEKSSMTKKNSCSIAMFDSERYLSWWSTFLGLLEVWGGTAVGWFLTQKPQLNLACRPWLQCGKRPMYKNARVETEQHGSKCLCGAGWAEGWLLVVGITSPWVLRSWLACAASPRVLKLMTWSPLETPARALSFLWLTKTIIGLPLLCQEHLLLFMHERFLSMQEAGADWQVQSRWKILGVFLEHWKVWEMDSKNIKNELDLSKMNNISITFNNRLPMFWANLVYFGCSEPFLTSWQPRFGPWEGSLILRWRGRNRGGDRRNDFGEV